MAWPAQRLQVAVIVCPAMSFGFDVVYRGCWYGPAIRQALLADVPVTLQNADADDVPLTAVSSLVSALSPLMLLPAFMKVIIAVT